MEVIRTLSLSPEVEEYFRYDALGLFLRNSELLDVGGILVDVENVVRRRFRCDGSCCLPEAPLARGGHPAGDCCHNPWVPLSERERQSLLAHLRAILPFMAPEARQAAQGRLADGVLAFSYRVRARGRHTGLCAVRWQANGDCLFRAIEESGSRRHVRCAIHSYLLHARLPLWGIKPLNCWIWPLALVPLYDGRLLLTVHTPETHTFTAESRPHASRQCLLHQPPDAPPVYRAFEQELRRMLGDPFYEHLQASLARSEPAAGAFGGERVPAGEARRTGHAV